MEGGEKDNYQARYDLEILMQKESKVDFSNFDELIKIFGEQPFIAISIEQDGVFKSVNHVMSNISEYSIKEMMKWTLEDRMKMIHPHDLKIIVNRQKKRDEGIEIVPYVFFRIISKSGEFKWVEVYSKDIKYEGRKALLSFIIDVTDKKENENNLRESEQRFRGMAEQSLIGMVILQDGVIKFVNQAIAELCEYSIEEIRDWSLNEFLYKIHPDDRMKTMNQMKATLEGDNTIPPHGKVRIITKSGKEKLVEGYSKLFINQGKPAIFATLSDFKEKK